MGYKAVPALSTRAAPSCMSQLKQNAGSARATLEPFNEINEDGLRRFHSKNSRPKLVIRAIQDNVFFVVYSVQITFVA
eukprot:scaffold179101_cov14-Tisochrysis_lutea.AAC.1